MHNAIFSHRNSYPLFYSVIAALLQNPREMIQGRIFSEMIRIQARKSELRPESRSYRPKVRVTAGHPPRIRTESPRKGTRIGFRCFYRKPPLKPSWIHLIHTPFFTASSLWCSSLFFSIARDNFLHRAHRLSAFASNFPFATMVYCTRQQEIYQESQRSDAATGNAGWPSQTQTQTQRCGALSTLNGGKRVREEDLSKTLFGWLPFIRFQSFLARPPTMTMSSDNFFF